MFRDSGRGLVDYTDTPEISGVIAYELNDALQFYFDNPGCPLLCIRPDGKRTVCNKFLQARAFYEESQDDSIEDTENEF